MYNFYSDAERCVLYMCKEALVFLLRPVIEEAKMGIFWHL